MGKVRDRLLRIDQYQDELQHLMDQKITDARHRLDIDIEKLKGLSPLDRLKGGYSYIADDKGNNIRSISGVQQDDELSLYVTDGVIRTRVIDTDRIQYDNDR